MDGIGYRIKLTMMENEEVKMTDAYTQDARRSRHCHISTVRFIIAHRL